MSGAGSDNEAELDVEMWCAVQCSAEARGELVRGLWAIDGGGKAQIERCWAGREECEGTMVSKEMKSRDIATRQRSEEGAMARVGGE